MYIELITASQVDARTKVPLISVLTTAFITLILVLINVGSTTAFNALISLVVADFLGSYIPPIPLMLYTRIYQPDDFHFGP